ncbi:LptF/LptG family permease, partial [Myxococcota bacterium]|nr:LptF/LptG family permease [Myxococcota bacterium]
LRVPFLFGFLLTLIATVTMSIGEPWGVKGLRRLMTQSAQDALARGIRPGEFVEWVPGVTFYAEERDGELLKDVVFADRRDAKKPVVISARTGRVVSGKGSRDIIFALDDGAILLRDMTSGAQRVVHFEKSRYRLDVGKLVKKKAITLTSTQAKDIPTLIEQKSDPKYRKNWALLTITLHRKFSVPLATLIFALLAVPLATRSSGGARARGFLYSSGIVAAYYYVGRALELAARSGKIDAVLATWTPNIVGVIALVWLLIRFKRKWI